MSQYKSRNNAEPAKGEVNYSPSLTIPNEAMSLREIMDRYARGLPLSRSNKTEVYHGEEEMPDLHTMDLSEIHDLAEANTARLKDYNDFQRRQQEQQLEAKERKLIALQAEVDRYRSAATDLNLNQTPPNVK